MQKYAKNMQKYAEYAWNTQKIRKKIRREICKIRKEYADFLYIGYFCKNTQNTQKIHKIRNLKIED